MTIVILFIAACAGALTHWAKRYYKRTDSVEPGALFFR